MVLFTGIAIWAVEGTAHSLGSFIGGISPAWIALIGTLFGGVLLKVTEKWLSKDQVKSEDAKQIREELRTQVRDQKADIKDLEDEVNEWRSKYYDLRDSYAKVQTELTLALNSIKKEASMAESKLPPFVPPS